MLYKLPRQRTHSALCLRNLISSQRKTQPAAIIIINFVSQRNISTLLHHDYLTETVRSPIPQSLDCSVRVSTRARRASRLCKLLLKLLPLQACLAPPPSRHGNQLHQAVDRQQPPSTCQASSRTVRHPEQLCSSSYVAASGATADVGIFRAQLGD